MATYYLDFENGNDASTGADWANAWKTLNNGATAARIAPGDEIRIAKTADPTSIGDGTWTKKSATVTLATAQTTNIYLDGSWTAANSGSVGTTSTRKEGSNAATITTASTTATSTKYAYYATGTLDLSSYDAITFWFRTQTASSANNNYQLKLCSDATGDTAVDTFDIPGVPISGVWVPFTLKRVGGGALGNSIQSIALYTGTVSPGNSRQIYLDDILGCDFDGLNLTSLISKNSAGYTDVITGDTWHGLQSINGTTVILANTNDVNAGSTSLRGYWTSGTSPATVTTYVRPTYKFAMQSGNASAQPIQDGGNASNLLTFSGGWNTTSNIQDGETWIDGQNATGYGIDIGSSRNYIKFQRLNCCRFQNGIRWGSSASTGHIFDNCHYIHCGNAITSGIINGSITACINNVSTPADVGTSGAGPTVFNVKVLNSAGSFSTPDNAKFDNLIYANNASNALLLQQSDINNLEFIDNSISLDINTGSIVNVKEAKVQNNIGSNTLTGKGFLNINKLTTSNNTNLGFYTGFLTVEQTNGLSTQLIGSATTTSVRPATTPGLRYNAVNNVITDNRSFWAYGNALSQTTTRHTASGIAWQINITNTAQTTNFPINFPIAKVACNANALVTVKAWVKLSHATDIGAKLLIQANEIAGVSADVTATKSADTNWEELTITFTPTVAGVAQIYLQGYWLANLADESIYVDDITVTQA